MGLDERIDGPVRLELSLPEVWDRISPSAVEVYSLTRLLRLLREASDALDSWDAAWHCHDPDTGQSRSRRIVQFRYIGSGFDDTVGLSVYLPPGSTEGPPVTPTLAAWGARSADAYRTLLNLAYYWHVPNGTSTRLNRVKHQGRGRNKDTYEPLSDDDIITLVFPTLENTKHDKQLLHDAWGTLEMLEAAGELRLAGRRVLPPEGSPRHAI